MRSVCGKAPQLLEGSLQSCEHGVQYRSKSSQFIFLIPNRKPGSQILGRYFLRFAGHRVNGCQRFASQGVTSETGKQYSERKSNEQYGGELTKLSPHFFFIVGHPQNDGAVAKMMTAGCEPDAQTIRKTPRGR